MKKAVNVQTTFSPDRSKYIWN